MESRMTALSSQAVTLTGFNLDLPVDTVAKYLQMAFSHNTLMTGKVFVPTDALQYAFTVASQWLVKPKRVGLKIIGGKGTGKTTLLQSIQDVVNVYRGAQSVDTMGLRIVQTLAITEACSRGDENLTIKKMIAARALGINDLGVEPSVVKYYGLDIMPLVEIIHQRSDANIPTVITTNLNENELVRKYGDRVFDRLRDMTTILLDGTSNRNNL